MFYLHIQLVGKFQISCSESQGRSGCIALLWRYKEKVSLSTYNKNHIDVIVRAKDGNTFRLTGIYGEPDRNKKRRDILSTFWLRLALFLDI